MKYNEWNTEQNSIFAELDDLNPNGIIGELGVSFLELYYSTFHGEKTIPKALENKSTSEIATLLDGFFMKQWVKLKENFETNLPVGFESETIIDEKNVDVSTKETDNKNTNKVTAFNTDLFSDDSSNDSIINELDNRERDKQYTQKKTSINSIDKQRKMIEKNNLTRMICVNISSVIGLSIY